MGHQSRSSGPCCHAPAMAAWCGSAGPRLTLSRSSANRSTTPCARSSCLLNFCATCQAIEVAKETNSSGPQGSGLARARLSPRSTVERSCTKSRVSSVCGKPPHSTCGSETAGSCWMAWASRSSSEDFRHKTGYDQTLRLPCQPSNKPPCKSKHHSKQTHHMHGLSRDSKAIVSLPPGQKGPSKAGSRARGREYRHVGVGPRLPAQTAIMQGFAAQLGF